MKGCLLDCNTLPFAWQKVFCWFGLCGYFIGCFSGLYAQKVQMYIKTGKFLVNEYYI